MSKVYDLGDEDEGFVLFKHKGKDINVDLFEVLKRISDIKTHSEQFSETEVFWLNEVKEYLIELGFDGLSNATALKFIKIVSNMVDDLKKNIESSLASQNITE